MQYEKKTHVESGLAAAVLSSEKSVEEVENQVMTLLKKHIPPKKCPLAGNFDLNYCFKKKQFFDFSKKKFANRNLFI